MDAGEPRRSWAEAHPVRLLVAIWLAWAACLFAFQELVVARLEPQRPDLVLSWTWDDTGPDRHEGRPYLADPTLNAHVAFDSEYYLSIAVAGYDDTDVPQLETEDGSTISANYAFMPLYPWVVGAVAAPMRWLGLAAIPAATIAAVAVSVLGALVAMLALARLAEPRLGRAGAVRAAFYLLAFPSGFFLAQAYAEGLFLALALGSLALAAANRPLAAGAVAAAAVLARPVGLALVLPLALGAVAAFRRDRATDPEQGAARARRDALAWGAATLAPIVAFAAWSWSPLGRAFETVQREVFHRAAFDPGNAIERWSAALGGLGDALPETRAYFALELAAVALALGAAAWALRRWPGPALFSAAAIGISVLSGPPQGMIRYALAAPAIFLMLARAGEHPAFDRAWTLLSVLLLGLLAALFGVDFWVG
jgi:hypothetical protein